MGGVIRGGQLAWFAYGSNLEVFSLRTGQRVAGQTFDEKSVVTCVAEVKSNDISSCLLIIAVQRSQIGGLIYLFSVQGSRIVHRIDVIDKITSCCFICDAACKRGCLKTFNGCAAVGTDAGEVFLIDLNLNRCKESKLQTKNIFEFKMLIFFNFFFVNSYFQTKTIQFKCRRINMQNSFSANRRR